MSGVRLSVGDKVFKNREKGVFYEILRAPKPAESGNDAIVYDQNSICYKARPHGTGDSAPVFLKHPKKPAVGDSWFEAYVKYHGRMKEIVDSDAELKSRTYAMLDYFIDDNETTKYSPHEYWQALEWVDGGLELLDFLKREGSFPAPQRITFAKLLMYGIKVFHDAGIIHSDLKPENVMLFKADCTMGYNLRLIDFDRSLIEGVDAPWGHEGYSGTPGYISPEHVRGERPGSASDVFTCGIMLYQLLSKTDHPFQCDLEEYKRRVLLPNSAPHPDLIVSKGRSADAMLCETVYACLDPDPAKRPSADHVHQVLMAWDAGTEIGLLGTRADALDVPEKTGGSVLVSIETEKPEWKTLLEEIGDFADDLVLKPDKKPDTDGSSGKSAVHGRLTLKATGKFGLSLGPLALPPVDGFGASLAKSIFTPEEARFFDRCQFRLGRESDGSWFVEPNPSSRNATFCNWEPLETRTPLRTGFVLSIGSRNPVRRGVVKGVMKVLIEGDSGVDVPETPPSRQIDNETSEPIRDLKREDSVPLRPASPPPPSSDSLLGFTGEPPELSKETIVPDIPVVQRSEEDDIWASMGF